MSGMSWSLGPRGYEFSFVSCELHWKVKRGKTCLRKLPFRQMGNLEHTVLLYVCLGATGMNTPESITKNFFLNCKKSTGSVPKMSCLLFSPDETEVQDFFGQ